MDMPITETIVDKLNRHHKIGIDIDVTLINGPNSRIIQEWCVANADSKELHLVTFRNGQDLADVARDLADAGVDINLFKAIHGSPEPIMRKFMGFVNKCGWRNDTPKWQRGLAHHKIDLQDWIDTELFCNEWKGQVCAEFGLTCLIDDMEANVILGCNKYNVEFIHSLK